MRGRKIAGARRGVPAGPLRTGWGEPSDPLSPCATQESANTPFSVAILGSGGAGVADVHAKAGRRALALVRACGWPDLQVLWVGTKPLLDLEHVRAGRSGPRGTSRIPERRLGSCAPTPITDCQGAPCARCRIAWVRAVRRRGGVARRFSAPGLAGA